MAHSEQEAARKRCWFPSWPPGCQLHSGYESTRESASFLGSRPTVASQPEAPGLVSATRAQVKLGSRGGCPLRGAVRPAQPRAPPSQLRYLEAQRKEEAPRPLAVRPMGARAVQSVPASARET